MLDIRDPLVLGFRPIFYFDEPDGLFGNSVNSAVKYLERNGLVQQKEYLQKFIALLSEMSANEIWRFVTVTGLQEAKTFNLTTPIAKDFKFTLKVKDSIDFKAASLMELYNSAMFDNLNGRELVPANLRRFSMGIILYDYRKIADSVLNPFNNTEVAKFFNLKDDLFRASHVYVEFAGCEFSPVNNVYSEINNAEAQEIIHDIDIKYHLVDFSSKFITVAGQTDITQRQIVGFVMQAAKPITRGTQKEKPKTNSVGESVYEENPWNKFIQKKQEIQDAYSRSLKGLPIKKVDGTEGMQLDTKALERLGASAALKVATNIYLGNYYGFSLSDLADGLAALRKLPNATKYGSTLDNIYGG